MVETKQCTKCKETKPLSEYFKESRYPTKPRPSCKSCTANYNKEWKAKNPGKVKQMEHNKRAKQKYSRFKKKYGLSEDQYIQLVAQQNGRCRLCKRHFDEDDRAYRSVVDHDHKTGIVRGLLHNNCNAGLGYFEDDPDILEAAWAYITAYRKRSGLY